MQLADEWLTQLGDVKAAPKRIKDASANVIESVIPGCPPDPIVVRLEVLTLPCRAFHAPVISPRPLSLSRFANCGR